MDATRRFCTPNPLTSELRQSLTSPQIGIELARKHRLAASLGAGFLVGRFFLGRLMASLGSVRAVVAYRITGLPTSPRPLRRQREPSIRRLGSGRSRTSSSRPPWPSEVMSRRVNRSPTNRRGSTRSTMLRFGLRAQPGAPRTGVPPSSASREQVAGIDRCAVADHRATGGFNRARGEVVAVLDGRLAGEDEEIGLRCEFGRGGGEAGGAPARRGEARSGPLTAWRSGVRAAPGTRSRIP